MYDTSIIRQHVRWVCYTGARFESRVRGGDGGYLRDHAVGLRAGADCGNHEWKRSSSMDLLQVCMYKLRPSFVGG